jgi:hypothetical protein
MRRDTAIAYGIICACGGLGLLNLIPVSLHMIATSAAIIYVGAQGSVPAMQTDPAADEVRTPDLTHVPLISSLVR